MGPALLLFFLLFPALALLLAQRNRLIRTVSPVVVCYVVGILLGNIRLLPPSALGLQDTLATLAVPISIPLMLFSLDIRRWRRLAGKALLSFALASFSVVVLSFIGHLFFRSSIPESWKVSGLLMGVYTGGTPNLAAIKAALNVETNTYLAVHTADVVVSAVYLLFVITAAKPLFRRLLPPFRAQEGQSTAEEGSSYTEILLPRLKGEDVPPLLTALGLTIIIVAAVAAISALLPQDYSLMAAILTITTLSILASLIPRVRSAKMTFQLGYYFILLFCLVVGSMADLEKLLAAAPNIILFVTVTIFGSLLLHLLLCRLFRVDVDTMLITSVAAICSPPFVGMVATALRNTEVIMSGITTGIIGYAIGNYLGIFLGHLFRLLFP